MATIKKNGVTYGNCVNLPVSNIVDENSTDSELATSKATYDVLMKDNGLVELTQEEYDALPEKDDGTLYCVTNAESFESSIIKQKIYRFKNTAGTGWTPNAYNLLEKARTPVTLVMG